MFFFYYSVNTNTNSDTNTVSIHQIQKMPIDYYYHPISAPCRSVLLLAKAIGVDLNLIFLDLMKGEHLNPEFTKLNPQHLVPTINDDGFVLWESRAILKYLVDRYAKDDSLAPNEPKLCAMINQRLYFDGITLFPAILGYFVSKALYKSY